MELPLPVPGIDAIVLIRIINYYVRIESIENVGGRALPILAHTLFTILAAAVERRVESRSRSS